MSYLTLLLLLSVIISRAQLQTNSHLTSLIKNIRKAGDVVSVFDLTDRHGSRKNVFYSPLSLQMAMTMLYFGTNGRTKSEIKRVFNLPGDKTTLLGFKQLTKIVTKTDKGDVNLANGLFMKKSVTIKDRYRDIMNRYFSAEIRHFRGDPANVLNRWIEQKTNNKIKHPFQRLGNVELILINALYFNQRWKIPFPREATRISTFHNIDGGISKVKFMRTHGHFKWSENTNRIIVEIPYERNAFTMTLVMPKDSRKLLVMEKRLFMGLKWNSRRNRKIVLKMPKFKVQSKFNLAKKLKKLGIRRVFGARADLTGMTKWRGFVNQVIQNSFIEVNEKGTKAAATTTVTSIRATRPGGRLLINKPFVFMIQHTATKTPLFLGRVTKL